MDANLKKLKKWLDAGNTYPKLAHYLNYKSEATIKLWFKRGQIPFHMVDLVLNIIDKKDEKNAK